jgi:hypothetical protein
MALRNAQAAFRKGLWGATHRHTYPSVVVGRPDRWSWRPQAGPQQALVRCPINRGVGAHIALKDAVRLRETISLFIDELLAQAIAGGLVDLPEGDALGTRAGRMERNRNILQFG